MGIIIDIVLIILFVLSAYLGFKKGLASVAVKLVAFVIAIVITLVLYRPIADFIIKNTDWDEQIQNNIEKRVDAAITLDDKEDANIKDIIVDGAKNELMPKASKSVAISIIYGVTIIGLFIVSRLVLLVINLISDAITSLPIIKQFNEVGGLAYGILRGLLIVYLIVLLLNIIMLFSQENIINNLVQSSLLTKMLIQFVV